MTEPDVALTDFALALECALFAWLAWRRDPPGGARAVGRALQPWTVLFFAAIACGALTGGLLHGFFLDPAAAGHAPLWKASMLALGVAAFGAWGLAARVSLPERLGRPVLLLAALQLLAHAAVVLFVSDAFVLAIAGYLPPVLVLLAGCLRRAPTAALGLGLTLLAGGLQVLRIGLHPTWFTHNALYHAVQFVALALIFTGLRRLSC